MMNNWKILVVEDEPDGQDVVSGILGYFGVATDVAGTAEQGLQLLERQVYTAAVVDIALPEMDGLELIQVVRENQITADMPCIAITAFHTTKVKHEALEAGFDAYLPKPLDDTAFIRELERIIERR